MFELFALVVVLLVLAFAIIGLVATVRWLVSSPANEMRTSGNDSESASFRSASSPFDVLQVQEPKRPKLHDDVIAARRLLMYLRSQDQIQDATFLRMVEFLNRKFGEAGEVIAEAEISSLKQASNLGHREALVAEAVVAEAVVAEAVVAEAVVAEAATGELVVAEIATENSADIAPWDRPDPPARPPRRSFAELMSGFMQEKNMRWGELTSGILIVLSAVGLVVSLQDELSQVIPYFSSILFLLITAAIIGAGIYTLKTWKLRNTSRGTLVIGMLLIPLNFVAACVLSGGENRRALDDPLLWLAVAVGLAGFTVLSLSAGKFLLRRRFWPLAVALVGSGAATILMNRVLATLTGQTLIESGDRASLTADGGGSGDGVTSFTLWMLTIVPVICFVIGSEFFNRRVNAKGYWSPRSTNRLLLSVGISAFALLAALSVVFIRVDSSLLAAVGVTPALMVTSLIVCWAGVVLRVTKTGLMDASRGDLVDGSVGASAGVASIPLSRSSSAIAPILGTSLAALGSIIAGIFLLSSIFHPITFVVNSAIVVIGLGWVIWQQRSFSLLSVWWVALAGGVLIGMNLLINNFGFGAEFDQWATAGQLKSAILNGESGLCLLGCGLLAMAASWRRSNRTQPIARKWEQLTGGCILLTGCLLALTASLLNRSDVFDAMTASSLLLVASVLAGVMAGVVSANLRRMFGTELGLASQDNPASGSSIEANGEFRQSAFNSFYTSEILAHLSAGLFLLGLLHSLLWNPWIATWMTERTGIVALHWVWVFAIHGLLFAVVSAVKRSQPRQTVFENWANWTAALATIGLGGLMMFSLHRGVLAELFRHGRGDLLVPELSFSLLPYWRSVLLVWVMVGLAMFANLLQRPTAFKAGFLIALWMLAWSFAAEWFADSISMASAVRWLLPAGGLVLAVLIAGRRPLVPLWVKSRNVLRLSGKSVWPKQQTQHLIHFALAVVVLIVLLISTVTVSQVMLNGLSSLGGPAAGSWFARMDKVVSFGGPLALSVGTFLLYAISERRPWLATMGSLVFQYIVVLAVVLLFLSPHPKLASAWFVNVLQSMSLGMTLYGFVWWWMRFRIEGSGGERPKIEIHTLINGFLVTSLAVLVYARFYWVPDQFGAWINSVGSLMGISASLLFAVLAVLVLGSRPLLVWAGFVLVAMIGAIVDHRLEQQSQLEPWRVFQILATGLVLVGGVGWTLLSGRFNQRQNQQCDLQRESQSSTSAVVAGFLLALGLLFAVRGAIGNVPAFWFYLILIGIIVAVVFGMGLSRRRAAPGFMAAGVAVLAAALVADHSAITARISWFHLSTVAVGLMAVGQVLFYRVCKIGWHEPVKRSFLWFPNAVLLAGAGWMLLAALIMLFNEWTGYLEFISLKSSWGVAALIVAICLLMVSVWNDRRKFWVVSSCALNLAVSIFVVSVLVPASDGLLRLHWLMLSAAMTALMWGIVWRRRGAIRKWLTSLHAPRLVALQRTAEIQLPIYTWMLSGVLMLVALLSVINSDERLFRYLATGVPFLLAVAMGCLSDSRWRHGLQLAALGLLTMGALMLGWADLNGQQIAGNDGLDLLARSLLVLAGMMFVYGGLVTRWVRPEDRWLRSLREATAVTCALAMLCLAVLVFTEYAYFVPDVGCGLGFREAAAIGVAVLGMVVGLVSIAVRPERDPFVLSMQGRQAYVYAAQLVMAGLAAHLYFSMPWFFQFGIKEYWPYIAMAVCFGGVGLAHLLEQRKLTVLGQPLFVTAAIAPLLVAMGIFAIDSRADAALVMLSVGLVYLLVGRTSESPIQSLLAGAAVVVFGNLALWIFYDRVPAFSFFEHPQLWLIPPAVSVLIAGQWHREQLSKSQLALLRYVCVAVIYVSSTSEIFLRGVEESLWPPAILALLSVGGILTGMMLQVRSFLYLGTLFLLTSMITMVAHAQARLGQFWPWWVFGIVLGMAILVAFGLFEKKKNEMKAMGERLKEWEV